jgi:hypothetical protein
MTGPAVTAGQRKQFENSGFLHLPGLYPAAMVDHILAVTARVMAARPADVVVDELDGGRAVLALLPAERVAEGGLKLYDLHVSAPEIRYLGLNEMLGPVLAGLFGQVPVLCHSVYQDQARLVAPLADAVLVPPRSAGHLISVFVAMDDVSAETGVVELVPGSHKLPFLPLAAPDGLDDWRSDMYEAAREAGLKKIRLTMQKGDVLVRHGQLLHGMAAPVAEGLAQKSYVFHYWSEADLRGGEQKLSPQAGAFWVKPKPKPLPVEVLAYLPFVEKAYLVRHPDVARAVAEGQFESGQAHYEAFGRHEGRMPF